MPDFSTLSYRAGVQLTKFLPKKLVSQAGEAIGTIYSAFPTKRRLLVEKNLARVQGSAPSKQQVRRAFSSYASYYTDAAQLPNLSTDHIAEKFQTEGYEHISKALDAKNGVILGLPHMGSWEWAGAWLAQVKKASVTAVVEPFGSPELLEWATRHRKNLGLNIIPLSPKAGTLVIQALKQGHVVCLLSDRYISGAGVEMKFFNETTTLPAGPATLALRTGAPILPAGIYFKDGIHHAMVRPALDISRQGKFREDVHRITAELTKELENLIRIAPEQWHLMSPNWPSDQELYEKQ